MVIQTRVFVHLYLRKFNGNSKNYFELSHLMQDYHDTFLYMLNL